MAEQYAAPIDHSTGSAAATTAAGAAGGALSGGWKGLTKGMKWLAIAGGAVFAVSAAFSVGLIALPTVGAAAITGLGAQLMQVALWGLGGAALGGLLGVGAGAITVPVGAAIGAAKGVSRAADKVSNERGSAALVQAQVAVAKAQAQSQQPVTYVAAPSASNYNAFPEQGSAMNQAPTRIMAGNDNLQYDGQVAGQQLAAAR